MSLLITQNGLEVLNFIHCDTPQIPEEDKHIPLTWTMTIAKYDGGYVTAYNFNRNQWELPSGGIEAGEEPEDCARRELMEESSQIADEFICKGVFKMRGGPFADMEYCAVYYTEITSLQSFVPNNETNQLRIWYPDDPDHLSTELGQWVFNIAIHPPTT